jgi:hypothetical protein
VETYYAETLNPDFPNGLLAKKAGPSANGDRQSSVKWGEGRLSLNFFISTSDIAL